MLKWQDIDVLGVVAKALGPPLNFTDTFWSEKVVTMSCLRPILHRFRSELLQGKNEDSNLSKTIKKSEPEAKSLSVMPSGRAAAAAAATERERKTQSKCLHQTNSCY